jgi:flagellin
MAGLVVQHNLNAINANNKLSTNVVGVKKATEKLSSGFAINRAGDNAAGLAISEKMRSQIRGLGQAIKNANDGISLIQTAEGGLNETHAILQRMRELAVQSANGTYQDELDREAIQLEVDALKSEIDRISNSTEYNKIKLLDGSLGGASSATGAFGPRYGTMVNASGVGAGGNVNLAGSVLTSSRAGTQIEFTTGASGKGAEHAWWCDQGITLKIELSAGVTYTQAQINDLIKNAKFEKDTGGATPNQLEPPEITFTIGSGVFVGSTATLDATEAGVRAFSGPALNKGWVDMSAFLVSGNTTEGFADEIRFLSNNYGDDTREFTIKATVARGKEWVEVVSGKEERDPNVKDGQFVLHLATGTEYTKQDIEGILRRAGLDYQVDMRVSSALTGPDGDEKLFISTGTGQVNFTMEGGAGVGKDQIMGTGQGLTFQIGANGVADQRVSLSVENMSASALGVANADVSTQALANEAIETIDRAVSKVSFQRAGLGALQNRLESTINNLTVTQENLTAAESQIRDTDMAKEMIDYTKFNILQQAAQAMLAQANQAPQAILQLLG